MRTILLCLFMALSSLVSIHAQVTVSVTPVDKNIIKGEAALLKVTIINNSGRTLKFENKENAPWISIHAEKGGTQLLNIARLTMPSLTLDTGKSISSTVNVASLFNMASDGFYRVYASYLSPFDGIQYKTQEATFNIALGKKIASQKVGIPPGKKGAGNTCQYSLLTVSKNGVTYLYMQVDEVETGKILQTKRLGKFLNFAPPVTVTDSQNNLHLLFLNTTDIYMYVITDTDGNISPAKYFRRPDSGRAAFTNHQGKIYVTGATPYDPSAKKPDREAGDLPW